MTRNGRGGALCVRRKRWISSAFEVNFLLEDTVPEIFPSSIRQHGISTTSASLNVASDFMWAGVSLLVGGASPVLFHRGLRGRARDSDDSRRHTCPCVRLVNCLVGSAVRRLIDGGGGTVRTDLCFVRPEYL
eukprot:4591724-Prymnesium_polylepis.2